MPTNDILLPMSCDPPHFGHLHLIAEALRRCSGIVYVAILHNSAKNPLFSYHFRQELLHRSLRIVKKVDLDDFLYPNDYAIPEVRGDWGILASEGYRVRVITPGESLPDTYTQVGCPNIMRGIRNDRDLQEERAQVDLFHGQGLIQNYKWILHRVEDRGYPHISSSAVKGAVLNYHWASSMVFPTVERALWQAIHGIDIWSVTGPMASGKSTLCRQLKETFNCETILIDELNREIWHDDCPASAQLRQYVQAIDPKAVLPDIDFKRLRTLFADGRLADLQGTIEGLVKRKLRQRLREVARGQIVFIEWAQLAQMRLGYWSQGRAIVMDTPAETRETYLQARTKERGESYDPKFLAEIQARQSWSTDDIVTNLHLQTFGIADLRRFQHGRDSVEDLWRSLHR